MTQDRIISLVLQAQSRIFRLAERNHGLTLKAISLDSGIPYDTIRSYAGHKGAQVQMPISALVKLAGVIPDDLLSHLLEPADRHIVRNADDDSDLDDLGDSADEVSRLVRRARHPSSPGGTEIIAIEEAAIKLAARKLGRGGKPA